MFKEYSKEQLWKIYLNLPEELKEASASLENTDFIYDVCQKNGIEPEKSGLITKWVGYVLFGILPPEEFPKTLETELKIKKEIAKKISQEINRFVFYPVKSALEQLYSIGVGQTATTPTKTEVKEMKEEKETKREEKEEKTTTPSGKDTYRESIE